MPYSQFTSDERDRLQQLLALKTPIPEISRKLAKHRTSVARELQRNAGPDGYVSGKAQAKARIRRAEAKPTPKKGDKLLMDHVEKKLRLMHSPAQISGRLKVDFPEVPSWRVSAETIYTWAYAKILAGSDLKTYLRQGKRKRGKRLSSKDMRGVIKNRVPISERPLEVAEKLQGGHWEGDTVEGGGKRGYMATYVERKTKYLIAFPLETKHADPLARATVKAFSKVPDCMLRTITYDNGLEFARHQEIAITLRAKVYFATPYHSWERGLNEHTNGLLRQYFPKGYPLDQLTNRQLAKVVRMLNNRPRKILNFQTPAEAYARELCALQI
jgi:IS30 family transposase